MGLGVPDDGGDTTTAGWNVEEISRAVVDRTTKDAGVCRNEVNNGEDVLAGGARVNDGGTTGELLRAMVEESADKLVDGEAALKSKVLYEFNYILIVLDLPN